MTEVSHTTSRSTTWTEQQRNVFLDRYALKDQDGNPLEATPEETWRRVAQAIASVESGWAFAEAPSNAELYAERFYEAMAAGKLHPGGRILAGAGSGHHVTFFNCLSADTLVHLETGLVPIGELRGKHRVLSEGGVYREAEFRSYGVQELWRVELENGAVINATPDHEWVVMKKKNGTERVKTRELQGRRIPVNPRPKPPKDRDFVLGVRHGIVFGDGSRETHHHTYAGREHVYPYTRLYLFGERQLLADWFESEQTAKVPATTATAEYVRVNGLTNDLKALPPSSASPSYWRGFIAGLIATDGHVDKRGCVMLHNKDAQVLLDIVERMPVAGFVPASIRMTREFSPYDGTRKPIYKLAFLRASVSPDDLLRPTHRTRFLAVPVRTSTLAVTSVRPRNHREEVFCCVEPETHTITISHGYLTGQCYALDYPEDSRGGILDSLKLMTEIMARGGGVGINFSSLRPRGSYIKTVNGHATGPVSWMELFSVATGDIIQQGGSRRGALLGMLDVRHPDIEEFITQKRKHPGKLQHANLSVAISDDFMEAVKHDREWHLTWPLTPPGEAVRPEDIRKTVRARDLWQLIAESAWASAEPGLVFLERMNRENNLGYCERLVTVNPCGELPLSAFGVCNLASLNLSEFVKDGQFDFADFRRHVELAVRFLDDVIDCNEYFLPENEEVQRNTRRMGLGTMGLADALIKLRVRYGSEESLEWIDRIYSCLRDTAYAYSVQLARERGAFPLFDERYLKSPFIQRLPEQIQQAIAEHGIRNSHLLCNAPTGTTSLVAGVSSGIEPIYDFVLRRKDRTGEHVMYHPLFEAWKQTAAPDEPRPSYFVTAMELSPEEHVRVQARIQRYVDSSISKTCNLPWSTTPADIAKLYEYAYDLGVKGLTVFRDGSREGVLESLNKEKDCDCPEPPKSEGYKRPLGPLEGTTYKIKYPFLGQVVTLFATVNGDGVPRELFGAGKGDQSVMAPLAWAISKLLQYGMDPREIVEELWEFEGNGVARNPGCKRAVRGLANAFAWAIERYLDEHDATEIEDRLDRMQLTQEEYEEKRQRIAAEEYFEKIERLNGERCPECKFNAVTRESGCATCQNCGFSKCG